MRRRRRRRPGTRAATSDAFELFLDALCNALGVIMFILLCLVVFAKVTKGTQTAVDPVKIEAEITALEARAAALELTLAGLLQALAAMPPSGDPALIKRWQELLASLEEMRTKKLAEVEGEKNARAKLAASAAALQEAEQRKRNLDAELARLDDARKRQNTVIQFVRVARFKPDARKAVLVLCGDARVSLAKVEKKDQSFSEPSGTGIPVSDAASAKLAVRQLMEGRVPTAWRVEIAVWPSGFTAYKLLERELIEQRYGINPLPLPSGESLQEGAGGVQ